MTSREVQQIKGLELISGIELADVWLEQLNMKSYATQAEEAIIRLK